MLDKPTLPKESKKKPRPAKEKQSKSRRETVSAPPPTVLRGNYFCAICYVAFEDKNKLDDHMRTHRELEVTADSCRMEEQPAGVF
jgi:hypothetical protein